MSNEKLQTLERAILILDCFTLDQPELGVREVSRMVELSSSTTGRIMAGMKELGLLSQNPDTHAYSLGAKVLKWAGVYTSTLDLRNKALPALEELHHLTRETISLYIVEGNERVCVERFESPQNVRIVAHVGRRVPLYVGSAGKLFLAFLSPEQRERILGSTAMEPLTPNTIIDKEMMIEELEKVRQQGYSISYGEWIMEAAGIAAPIFGPTGEILAAVTISGPTQRFTEEKVNLFINELVRVARQISKDIGYSG